MTSIKPEYLRLLSALILFSIALGLRLAAVNDTVIGNPIRNDASEYYSYALNLKFHHVYSRTIYSENRPAPDAYRSPGYPAFLVPLAEYPPTRGMLRRITLFQALLDSLTVLLALGLFRAIMSEGWALGAALLTAISPHLISATTFLLSETLFTFLMVLTLWLVMKTVRQNSRGIAFLAGLTLAAAALTRPTLQYFIIPLVLLLMFTASNTGRSRLAIPLLAGFILSVSPWALRNINTIGSLADPSLTTYSVYHGIYPDFMYRDIPESRAIPYRFDPRSEEISGSRENLLREIRRRFSDEPARHIKWYLLGKPASLFDWNVAGTDDIYIYQVAETPYASSPVFTQTYRYMKLLHWPLVILALAMAIAIWLPVFKGRLSGTALFTARLLSLLILYFIAVHIVAAPYPRYSVPLRPVVYGLVMLLLSLSISRLRSMPRQGNRRNLEQAG